MRKEHVYFYPGSFELKLLKSTRQGDFASLQRGLNPLINLDYKSTLTTAKVFLSITTTWFFSRNYTKQNMNKAVYNMFFFTKTVSQTCDVLHCLESSMNEE